MFDCRYIYRKPKLYNLVVNQLSFWCNTFLYLHIYPQIYQSTVISSLTWLHYWSLTVNPMLLMLVSIVLENGTLVLNHVFDICPHQMKDNVSLVYPGIIFIVFSISTVLIIFHSIPVIGISTTGSTRSLLDWAGQPCGFSECLKAAGAIRRVAENADGLNWQKSCLHILNRELVISLAKHNGGGENGVFTRQRYGFWEQTLGCNQQT